MLTRKRKVPPVVQLTQTECGLCSSLMILRYHGSRESLRSLRTEYEPGRDGLSVRQLRDLLQSRGLHSQMYRAKFAGLGKLELPVIIYWENYHFVVLESLDEKRATIVDPATGRRRVALADFQESFSGLVITGTPSEDFQPIYSREPNPWKEYLLPVLEARWRMVLVALLSLLVFGASLTVPMITKALIDASATTTEMSLGWLVIFGVVAFAGGYLALTVLRALVLTSLSVHVGRRTMNKVFGHMLVLPYQYFSSRAPGELLFRLNSVNQIRDLMSSHLVQGALDLALSVAMLWMMFVLSPILAMVSGAYYIVVLLLLIATKDRVGEALESEMTQASKSQSMQLEAVVAVTALKLSGSEQRFLGDWKNVYERSLGAIKRRSNLQGWINSGVAVAQIMAPITILIVGLNLVSAGVITIGTVVAFQAVSATFFGLASSIFGCYTLSIQARTMLDRLADITGSDPVDDSGTLTSDITGVLDVRNVTFRYTKHSPATLQDVSIEVRPGEKVAIVGRSGSGKSTLGKLLCGLFIQTEGDILYNGHSMQEYRRDHFYRYVGYVPQEVHLLNRSILDNIVMGHTDLGEDDARVAAHLAQIGPEIESLPMGYRTLVSEMGANFSGGQRQRLALARALARQPRLLILDEATSALDQYNEARITEALAERACTVVVIAHRMSTVVDADRIYVMDRGRVVQCGPHDELIAIEGPYQALYAASAAAA